MTYREKASLTRRAMKLVNIWCLQYTGASPCKHCRGCRLYRAVDNENWAAVQKALKVAKI